jgi:hypothetical protein
VGVVFHARPRGAYNHAFFGDNNFQLYAYGQNITHSGGSTSNGDRHVLLVDGRYFVILDDLEVSKPEGSVFSWLYHVLQDVPLEWNPEGLRFSYRIKDVTTVVQHLNGSVELEFENLLKEEGLFNPITNEDYTDHVKPITTADKTYSGPYPEVVTHNIWLSNREPKQAIRFMVVIYPYREGTGTPVIKRVDDLTVRINREGRSETVTFDPAAHPGANIGVEL